MDEPLRDGDHGPYGTLSARPRPDGLAILFIPALSALLTRAEQLKGSSLTEQQVLLVRDAAVAVATRADAATATIAQRGYPEVDPENVWPSWWAIRANTAGEFGAGG